MAKTIAETTATKKTTRKRPIKKAARTTDHRMTIGVACVAATSTVLLSMHMNVMAFTKTSGSLWAIGVGIALPLWILALTYIGVHMQGRNKYAMYGAYALAAFALAVSLPHLVGGFSGWGLAPYEAWSLAVVTDLLQVIAKLSIITMLKK
jgi:hypothetical protein